MIVESYSRTYSEWRHIYAGLDATGTLVYLLDETVSKGPVVDTDSRDQTHIVKTWPLSIEEFKSQYPEVLV